jgi:hypothetical protein
MFFVHAGVLKEKLKMKNFSNPALASSPQIPPDPSRSLHILSLQIPPRSPDPSRSLQIPSDHSISSPSRSLQDPQIPPDPSRSLQIPPDPFRSLQNSIFEKTNLVQ